MMVNLFISGIKANNVQFLLIVYFYNIHYNNMKDMKILDQCFGFQWDSANADKNWLNHQVSCAECEEVFFNEPVLLFDDIRHSQDETRYYILGKTNSNRKLFVVFTIRQALIRVISARDMSKKEHSIYEQA